VKRGGSSEKLVTFYQTPRRYVPKESKKSKGIPRQAEVAVGVQGRLRPRIFSTFGTTRVVGRQSNALAAFTPGEIAGTHFQRLSRPQGALFCWKEPRKKSQVTPPVIDPGTVRLVAQRLNHYDTPGAPERKYSSDTVLYITPWRYTTHSGCVFYSPLSGFSLLAYEVT
jgi:hypothetical protein